MNLDKNIKTALICLGVILLAGYFLLGFYGTWSLLVIGFVFIALPIPILKFFKFSLEESFFYSFFVSIIGLPLFIYYLNLIIPLNISIYLVVLLFVAIDAYLIYSKKVKI
jgi:ABC-type iron transport system FetAB permease component